MKSRRYEDEQKNLNANVVRLREGIKSQEEHLQVWISLSGRSQSAQIWIVSSPARCTTRLAFNVGAPDKTDDQRRQSIHICYELVGFIPLDTLTGKKWHGPKIMPFQMRFKLLRIPSYGIRPSAGAFKEY